MKMLLRLALILVLLVIIAAVAGLVMIDGIATAAVREGAEFATQTDVEVQKVDVKVISSEAEIINLDISNPDGPFLDAIADFPEEFKDAFNSFLLLGNAKAQVTVGSITSDTIEIDKIELSDIDISLIGKDGEKNYEVILASLKRFQGDSPPAETSDEKKVVIKELIISNITVYYYFDEDRALGAIAVGPKKITLADDEPMVLENVGSGGLPMSQVTADIISDILVQVMANLAGDLGGHMKGLASSLTDTLGDVKLGQTLKELDLGGNLEALGDLGLNVGDLGADVLEGAGDAAGDAVKGIGEKIGGLGGLIGGEDEDE